MHLLINQVQYLLSILHCYHCSIYLLALVQHQVPMYHQQQQQQQQPILQQSPPKNLDMAWNINAGEVYYSS